LDLIERALELFDEVIVVVASNPSKDTTFSVAERVKFLKVAVEKHPRVSVECWEGLTVDFARKNGAATIIRGIRATSDFDYEFQMALTNRHLAPEIETVFLMPSEKHFFLSSRLIKEIARLQGDVTAYVPDLAARHLKEKFSAS